MEHQSLLPCLKSISLLCYLHSHKSENELQYKMQFNRFKKVHFYCGNILKKMVCMKIKETFSSLHFFLISFFFSIMYYQSKKLHQSKNRSQKKLPFENMSMSYIYKIDLLAYSSYIYIYS